MLTIFCTFVKPSGTSIPIAAGSDETLNVFWRKIVAQRYDAVLNPALVSEDFAMNLVSAVRNAVGETRYLREKRLQTARSAEERPATYPISMSR